MGVWLLQSAFSEPESNAIQANIGFVGCGNMGTAILRGWMESGIAVPSRLAACVRSQHATDRWRDAGLQVRRAVLAVLLF